MRVLDLFCGAGGAGEGYARAWAQADVIGVDLAPQPRYPHRFVQGDALAFLATVRPGDYDLIHASPPCQRFSPMTARWGRQGQHPDLISAVRAHLQRIGGLWVIENVPGAPLHEPVTLCGSMFALGDSEGRGLRRHRLFEASFTITPPRPCRHVGQPVGVYGHPGGSSRRDGIRFAPVASWREAMGIDWMTPAEMALAIPPAYTSYIAKEATR